jgi:hypothetical protein
MNDLLSPSLLIPIAGAIVVLLGVGIGVFTVMSGKKKGAATDAWARAAYSIWTGGEDSATWTPERAQAAFKNWYGAPSGGQAQRVIDELVQGQTGNRAWDLVRALDLVRIGLAAGYLDRDQSQSYEARIGQTLQRTHASWEALASQFEMGMRQWHQRMGQTDPKETERVQRNLPALRAQIWPRVAFQAKLEIPD